MALRDKNSTQQRRARYVQGGMTDVYPTRLGWWERRALPRALDDVRLIVRKDEQGRPDKISYRMYNQNGLGWLVLQYNNIVDINTELVTDAELILPNPARVNMSILTKSVGGVSV